MRADVAVIVTHGLPATPFDVKASRFAIKDKDHGAT
jgi:hypothetical protein